MTCTQRALRFLLMSTFVCVQMNNTHIDVLHISHLTSDCVKLLRRLTHVITVLHTHTHISNQTPIHDHITYKSYRFKGLELTSETTLLVMTPPNSVLTVFFWNDKHISITCLWLFHWAVFKHTEMDVIPGPETSPRSWWWGLWRTPSCLSVLLCSEAVCPSCRSYRRDEGYTLSSRSPAHEHRSYIKITSHQQSLNDITSWDKVTYH